MSGHQKDHPQRSALLLAALLGTAGVAHMTAPRSFDRIVPHALAGDPRVWTYASGTAELAIAAAVANPRTRRHGALAAAGLFTAILPANVQMAVDWKERPVPLRVAAYARLPLQIPLVTWALGVRRTARSSSARKSG